MSPRLEVSIGPMRLKNPVMTASGTCGSGLELAPWADLSRLGAVVGKTVTSEPREGNDPPRTFETASGMLNSIGLQNPGIEKFVREVLPAVAAWGELPKCSPTDERPFSLRSWRAAPSTF